VKTYEQALEYLYSFIPQRRNLHTGEKGILRTKYLLSLIGNPQEKLRVIHVAGTSGKGSTAFLINRLMSTHGFKVGFQISPHLIDLRERFQVYTERSRSINNELISKELFVKRLNEIISSIEKARKTEWGKLTFFEIGVCLAFYIFYKENVDYAVMETGLGGLYDGTNVVENPKKVAVITKIGFDHQSVLGYTLSDIASQKAGIIQTGNIVITVQQKLPVMKIFYSRCRKMKSEIFTVKKGKNFRTMYVTKTGTTFNWSYKNSSLSILRLGLIGEHQVENASIALATLYELSKRDRFKFSEEKTRSSLKDAQFPGRCEIYSTKYKDVIIDGAHNPQKMKAFIGTLKKLYPNQKFDFMISFSEGKNQLSTLRGILKQIVPIAQKIYLTNFILDTQGDMVHSSIKSERIIKVLKELKFPRYEIIESTKKNVEKIIKEKSNPLVITGSLYLIGSLYKDIKHVILHSL